MTWGWLKPLLDWLAEIFGKVVTTDVKATEAHTTKDTHEQMEAIRKRVRPVPPPEPPADGR